MANNPLHKKIGEMLKEEDFPDYKIIKDPACGGSHNIPLFIKETKSNDTEYCNVDILILKEEKINVIIEIDESNKKPTHICGKFLTSALSSYYIHNTNKNNPIKMDDSVLFIQIITSELNANSKKPKQFQNIEQSINDILPLKNINIKKYLLIPDSLVEQDLLLSIKNHLNNLKQ